jgi:hypothetical protein
VAGCWLSGSAGTISASFKLSHDVSKHVDEVILQYLETDNLKTAWHPSDANVAVPYYAKS